MTCEFCKKEMDRPLCIDDGSTSIELCDWYCVIAFSVIQAERRNAELQKSNDELRKEVDHLEYINKHLRSGNMA